MSLPENVRVKLSTEDAGTVAITPVVVRQMPLRELVELMLDLTGKDAARIRELLLRGTLVSSASRYRWTGWDAGLQSVKELLRSFPDPDPTRPFAPERCVRVTLEGSALRVELPRAALDRARWLRRRGFWDVLLEAVAGADLKYAGYSYREHADCYRLEMSPAVSARLREHAHLVPFPSLRAQLLSGAVTAVGFFATRPAC